MEVSFQPDIARRIVRATTTPNKSQRVNLNVVEFGFCDDKNMFEKLLPGARREYRPLTIAADF